MEAACQASEARLGDRISCSNVYNMSRLEMTVCEI